MVDPSVGGVPSVRPVRRPVVGDERAAYDVESVVSDGLKPLPDSASQNEIRETVNVLMDRFITKCLRDYHEGATRIENECWAQNVFMQKKVH